MAINTIKATIQMRKGLEQDFDADKMTAGEWAVSTDTKYVRMCFAPGIVVRMATYEAFDQDMAEIQTILATCQNIQVAVDAMAEMAEQHKNAAAISAEAARASEANARASEGAAATSEQNAKTSETTAAASENVATQKAGEASASAASAATSATTASDKADAAATSEQNAINSAAAANSAQSIATTKADEASDSASAASGSATEAESYAHGGTGTRTGEDADNSKYYYEQTKQISQSLNGIIPMGTVTFADLPTSGMEYGYMYNISDAFMSDERFGDGGGVYYGAGNNVIWVSGDKWDVTAGSGVTGVKGAAETTYRQGNVDITPENIGLGNVPNVSTNDQTPTFVQAGTRENIVSGEKLTTIFGKIKKWFADLKTVAFTGNYNDLSNKPASLPANGGNANYATTAGTAKGLGITDQLAYDGTATGWGKEIPFYDKNGVKVGYINRLYNGNGTVDMHIGADKGNVIVAQGIAAAEFKTHGGGRLGPDGNLYMTWAGDWLSNVLNTKIPTTASCNKNWNWNGQGGQPTWLWGGEDGTNMYVYNPANFNVNYANTAGTANYAPNYLPLSGGVVAGDIYCTGSVIQAWHEDNTEGHVFARNCNRYAGISVTGDGGFGLYDLTNRKWAMVSAQAGAEYRHWNNWAPGSSNAYTLGTPSYLYSTVYAKTGTINTSDRTKKHDIKDIMDVYEQLFLKLQPKSFVFNDGDRVHIGAISQDVEEAMIELGIEPKQFAGFCKDIHYEYKEYDDAGFGVESTKYAVTDEDGNIVFDYALRYQEFIFLTIHMVQQAWKRMDAVENEMKELKAQLALTQSEIIKLRAQVSALEPNA